MFKLNSEAVRPPQGAADRLEASLESLSEQGLVDVKFHIETGRYPDNGAATRVAAVMAHALKRYQNGHATPLVVD